MIVHDLLFTIFNLVEDAKLYLESITKLKNRQDLVNQVRTVEINECPQFDESDIITNEDCSRAQMGLPPQRYDAYLLFDNFDIHFATEILTKMETEYDLKVIKLVPNV